MKLYQLTAEVTSSCFMPWTIHKVRAFFKATFTCLIKYTRKLEKSEKKFICCGII